MEAFALENYTATSDDQLAFQKGDLLRVTNLYGDWYLATLNRRRGYVPRTFIQLRSHHWYQGKIGRAYAEAALSGAPRGSFLIRDSESAPDEFSLSVRATSEVQHYKVREDGASGLYYIWPTKVFNSLNELVHFYCNESIGSAEVLVLRDYQVGRRLVQALFDFTPQQGDELPFEKGQIITVLEEGQPSDPWWLGELNGRRGHFPSNYVMPLNTTQ